MTRRERWIVYPLLFLALGTAWRDKVMPRTVPLQVADVRADRITCHRLRVTNSADGGWIRLGGRDLRDVIRSVVRQEQKKTGAAEPARPPAQPAPPEGPATPPPGDASDPPPPDDSAPGDDSPPAPDV